MSVTVKFSGVSILSTTSRRGPRLLEQHSVVAALYTWADDIDKAGGSAEGAKALRLAARMLAEEPK